MTLLNNILPEARRGKLKALLRENRLIRVIEAHNGLSGIVGGSARIEGEDKGQPVIREFDALWESSLTDSASKGHPDIEVVGFDSRLTTIQEILAVTEKPMIVDGDTGGDANNFEYMVSKLERAGVSAVIIEDKVFPKRNSLEAGVSQTLQDPEVFAQKIRRGKAVQLTGDFLIIARIESFIAGFPLEDALSRARTYLQAGVDGIMIHSKSKNPDELFRFAEAYGDLLTELGLDKPLVCVPTTYNHLTEDELAQKGFRVLIYANHLLRAAYQSMVEVSRAILLNQRSLEADPLCAPVRDIFRAVGFLDVKEKDQREGQAGNIAVIIPAAGEDEVLKPLLNGRPKAMLDIAGRTLLDRQVASLATNHLNDITVVAGYASDQMRAEGVAILENKDYENGSMMHSLMVARDKMHNGFLMLYADILLEDHIIGKLLDCREDIVLVADNTTQYHKYEGGKALDFIVSKRKHRPSRRRISFAGEHLVERIGANLPPETATHEFIGLARFSRTGAEQLMATYQDCTENFQGRFHEADDVSRLNFTDIIQEMIDRGFRVHFMEIHQGWLEIHRGEDLKLVNEFLQLS
ncbi:MAG: phosphoenolpyruvate mutase [Nitrospinaceae bacterium]|jgi:phosphoenolpyruvate phosphomutase|nr:MAG: phosphoenolpyruvate mutase [Nitrospinaceae bacterium]